MALAQKPPGLELAGGSGHMAQYGIHGILRERKNWLINLLYLRQEYEQCKEIVEQQLRECHGMCEFAIYVKALIMRQEGKVQESLALFQAVICLNPHNALNLKQVGRSL